MTTAVTNHRVEVIRPLFAVVLAMHGVAHFVGTTGNVSSISNRETVNLLGGAFATSNLVVFAVLALLWAIVGAGFIGVAVLVWRQAPTARHALIAVSLASLAIGVVTLWAGTVGVVINVALLVIALLRPDVVGLDAKR
jgi:hypothetical protein